MTRPPNIVPRGIRTSIPPGYVLGRIDPGTGHVQLIPLDALGAQLVARGFAGGGNSPPGQDVIQAENLAAIQAEDGTFLTR